MTREKFRFAGQTVKVRNIGSLGYLFHVSELILPKEGE